VGVVVIIDRFLLVGTWRWRVPVAATRVKQVEQLKLVAKRVRKLFQFNGI
jgi:hypothetical protein